MKNNFYEGIKYMVLTTVCIILLTIIIPTVAINSNASIINKLNDSLKGSDDNSEPKVISLANAEKVRVYITGEDKIQEVNLEEYICGVVANEMPASFDDEALKAQAIAARTFWASKFKTKCTNAKGADVCDSTHCQVYTSKDNRIKKWDEAIRDSNWNKIQNAVYETKGMVLSYNNELVLYPQYFATSSGKTENAVDAYWADVPYLKSVDSPGEEIAPKFKTEKSLELNDFIATVNKKYPKAELTTSNIENSISIVERSEAGGIKKIKVGKETLKGPDFRFLIGLNSTNFTYTVNEDEIIFDCKGYGHGVGMSQWGANVMGKSGKKYDEILKHYYTGVQIANLKFNEN